MEPPDPVPSLEGELETVATAAAHAPGHNDLAGAGKAADTRRQVDACSVQVRVVGYDIAGIDANADLERILRGGFVLFDQFPLDRYRRCHGRIALGEYGEHAVSGLLDDGSTKFSNDRSNEVIMEFDNLVSRVIAKLIENFR